MCWFILRYSLRFMNRKLPDTKLSSFIQPPAPTLDVLNKNLRFNFCLQKHEKCIYPSIITFIGRSYLKIMLYGIMECDVELITFTSITLWVSYEFTLCVQSFIIIYSKLQITQSKSSFSVDVKLVSTKIFLSLIKCKLLSLQCFTIMCYENYA